MSKIKDFTAPSTLKIGDQLPKGKAVPVLGKTVRIGEKTANLLATTARPTTVSTGMVDRFTQVTELGLDLNHDGNTDVVRSTVRDVRNNKLKARSLSSPGNVPTFEVRDDNGNGNVDAVMQKRAGYYRDLKDTNFKGRPNEIDVTSSGIGEVLKDRNGDGKIDSLKVTQLLTDNGKSTVVTVKSQVDNNFDGKPDGK